MSFIATGDVVAFHLLEIRVYHNQIHLAINGSEEIYVHSHGCIEKGNGVSGPRGDAGRRLAHTSHEATYLSTATDTPRHRKRPHPSYVNLRVQDAALSISL